MNRKGDPSRRSISAAIVLLAVPSSAAVPLLERGSLSGETTVESEHDPSRWAHGHDHRTCTQLLGNLSFAAADTDHRSSRVVVRVAPPSDVESAPASSTLDGPPPRAPPLT